MIDRSTTGRFLEEEPGMPKMSAFDAKTDFGELLDRVSKGKEVRPSSCGRSSVSCWAVRDLRRPLVPRGPAA